MSETVATAAGKTFPQPAPVKGGGGSAEAVVKTSKTVTIPLSGEGLETSAAFTESCIRGALLFPFTAKRARFRVSNKSARKNEAHPGAFTIKPFYIGTPSLAANGEWTGAFTEAPTKVCAGGEIPTSGEEFVSEWFNAEELIKADTLSAFSAAWTCEAGQTVVKSQCQVCWGFFGANCAAAVGNAAVPAGAVYKGAGLLDFRLEVETTPNTLPVVLILSDSTSAGIVEDSDVAPAIPGQHFTWSGQAALLHRYIAINAGLSGAEYANFATKAQWAFERFNLATTVPNAVILGCGINEATNLVTLKEWYEALKKTQEVCRELGIQRTLATTVMTQPSFKGGQAAEGIAAGATELKTTQKYANGNEITLDMGSEYEETVKVSGTPTGNGPYGTTLSAGTAHAHALGASVGLPTEKLRQSYNQLLRRGIDGIDGLIDFANAIPEYAPLARWWGTNASNEIAPVHPGAGAYALFGSIAKVSSP